MNIDMFLRHTAVVVQYPLLDVERIGFLLQRLDSGTQNRLPFVCADAFAHALNGVLQFLKLLARQTALIVVGHFAHNDGDSLVVGGVMTCKPLADMEYFGSQVAVCADSLRTNIQRYHRYTYYNKKTFHGCSSVI